MPAPASPPTTLLDFAADVLGGPVRPVANLSWPHGESAVWRIDGPAGAAILKAHRDAAKARRERAFLERWAPGLAPHVPRLLGARSARPRALLVEHRAGRVDAAPDAPGATRLHREAGAWLARLHALPHTDDDPVDVADAYALRADAWFARVASHLDGVGLREARARVHAALPALRGRRRVPCHRDFTPRNWLAQDDRLVAVIDFEHARPDLAEADLLRLSSQLWPVRPELRDAFLDGYGAPEPPPWIEGLEVLEAVATIAWAEAHADAEFAAAGRAVLSRLLGRPA